MKKCSKCELYKNETEFWVRKNRKSGVNSECKECCGIRRRANQEHNRIIHRKWCENNRERSRELVLAYQKRNKEKVNASHREWYDKNREAEREKRKERPEPRRKWAKEYFKKDDVKARHRINKMVYYALKKGKLIKPEKCMICNSNEYRIEAHHPDYEKPLEVIWLCQKCHIKIHQP